MESVEAELHDWVAGAVPDQGRCRRQLQADARVGAATGVERRGARRRRQPQPVRRRLGAGDCATVCPTDQRDRIELEMLEGMAPAQSRAVRTMAGSLLLYAPVVQHDQIDASIAYLARRLDENTAPENFLRALFTMHAGLGGVRRAGRPVPPLRSPSGIDLPTQRRRHARRRRVDGARSATSPTAIPTDPDARAATARRRAIGAGAAATGRSSTRIAGIDAIVAGRGRRAAEWASRPSSSRRAGAAPTSPTCCVANGSTRSR